MESIHFLNTPDNKEEQIVLSVFTFQLIIYAENVQSIKNKLEKPVMLKRNRQMIVRKQQINWNKK